MAFLFEQDRGLTVVKDEFPHLGPGIYHKEEKSQNQQHGYAPFQSTGQRVAPMVEKSKETQPGPGQYDIYKPMGDSGVQAYMNKSTIIVKVQGNGSSCFKSGEERFKAKKNQQNPGPGYYDYNLPGKGFKAKEPVSGFIDDLRQLNNQRKVTSIPPQKGQIGQQCQDIESLQEQSQSYPYQEKSNIIGPGSYEIKGTFEQKKNGITWSKERQSRFKQEQQSQVGPGKYNVNKRIVPRFQKNASPAFISETVRSYFDNLVYQTNSELKAELRKRTNFKDQTSPGPGQYDMPQGIHPKMKQREFQYFGSSLERFQTKENYNIGPGQYNLNNSFDALKKNKKKNYVNYTFLSTQPKEKAQLDQSALVPGPGAYNLNVVTLKQNVIKKFTQGYKGSFGSTDKRFDERNEQSDVGPGKYSSNYGSENQKYISSVFRSGSQRQPNQKQNDVGYYDINQYNISYKMQKQANFLKNLKRIDVVKPGFDSAQARFQQKKPLEASTSLPPTTTEVSFDSLQQYHPKQIKGPFVSKTKRMENQGYNPGPGVGSYNIDQNQWKKNSFNTHYNKLLEEDI